MTNIKEGSIGLGDESSIIEWYPAAVNQKFGWYTWDGGKFNLNSNEFKAGVNLTKSIYNNNEAYASLSEAEKKILKGKNDWEAWNAGDYSKFPFNVGFTGLNEDQFEQAFSTQNPKNIVDKVYRPRVKDFVPAKNTEVTAKVPVPAMIDAQKSVYLNQYHSFFQKYNTKQNQLSYQRLLKIFPGYANLYKSRDGYSQEESIFSDYNNLKFDT